MKLSRAWLIMLCIIPFAAHAAHVFIWNYDPLDRYFDPEIGDTVDGTYWLQQSLSVHGHTYVTDDTLPQNLSDYDVTFITLGWYRC
jgi:hypothetical protein